MNETSNAPVVKSRRRFPRFLKRLLVILGVLIAIPLVLVSGHELAERVRTPFLSEQERWLEDLHRLESVLVHVHPDLSHFGDPGLLAESVKALRSEIEDLEPSSIDRNRLLTRFLEIVALTGDPHTAVSNRYGQLGIYPFFVSWFADGPRLISSRDEHAALLGRRLVAVDGMNVDDVVERLRSVIPHSNELGLQSSLSGYLRTPGVLVALGVTERPDRVSLELADAAGDTTTVTLTRLDEGDFDALDDYRSLRSRTEDAVTPLYARRASENYWVEHLDEHDLLYVRYRLCSSGGELPIEAFWEQVFSMADSLEIETFVLDLRGNPGGNNFLHLPLAAGLRQRPHIDRPGHLFTLLDRNTFSAAITCAADMERETASILVGEGCGDAPHGTGDARYFTLPHSRLQVGVATLLWSHSYEGDTRRTIAPDILVQRSFADYRDGLDPVLETVLNLGDDFSPARSRPPVVGQDVLDALALLRGGDFDRALEAFLELHRAQPDRITLRRNNLSTLAWRAFHLDGDVETALALTRINARLHPDDPFVYVRRALMEGMAGNGGTAAWNYGMVIPKSLKRYFTQKHMNDHYLPF